jgi:hypothetical protein
MIDLILNLTCCLLYSHQRTAPPHVHDIRVENYALSVSHLSTATSIIAQQFGMPIGLSVIDQPKDCIFKIDVASGTLEDVLDALIQQCSGYVWSETKGIIHVDRIGFQDTLAEVRLDEFKFSRRTASDALLLLKNKPSVRRWISEHNLHEGDVMDAAHDLATSRVKGSVVLHNVTVRQALDAIVIASGLKWWGIIEWDTPKGNRISIRI